MRGAAEHLQSTLSDRAAGGEDAGSVATLVVSIWRDIDAVLAPIIGNRGVAALFNRTLHLIRHEHAWLTAAHVSMADCVDFETLHSTLSQRTSADIVIANGALLQNFLELLGSLIGTSLSERLLRPVVDTHTTDAPS
jgi:hypothetical protein